MPECTVKERFLLNHIKECLLEYHKDGDEDETLEETAELFLSDNMWGLNKSSVTPVLINWLEQAQQ